MKYTIPTPPRFDAQRLQNTLAELGECWGLPSSIAKSGVHHRYRTSQNGGSTQVKRAFAWVLAEFAPVRSAHLGLLMPGGFILPHVDAGPHYERWHVPIYAAGVWGDTERGISYAPEAGQSFSVRHWEPHSAWNDTDEFRAHLLIDRAIRVTTEHTPQLVYRKRVPKRYHELVRAAG